MRWHHQINSKFHSLQKEKINNTLNQSGSSLDSSTREFMESRFGYDFSNVIHNDETADRSANAINSLAYTMGSDIVFESSQYQPYSNDGLKLLSHELVHVIQQSKGGTHSPSPLPSNNAEIEARELSSQIVNGKAVHIIEDTLLGIARQLKVSKILTEEDLENLKDIMQDLLTSVSQSTRRRKTIALGLVEDTEGFQTLIYTINDNWTTQRNS